MVPRSESENVSVSSWNDFLMKLKVSSNQAFVLEVICRKRE